MTLAEEVLEAIRRDDVDAVESLLKGRTEKERAAVSRAVKEHVRDRRLDIDLDFDAMVALLKAVHAEKERGVAGPATAEHEKLPGPPEERNAAFALAVMGAVRKAPQVSRLLDWPGVSDVSVIAAVRVLTERNPEWLSDLPVALLETRATDWWPLVRELVRRKAVPVPDHPNYALGMVHGIHGPWRRDGPSLAQLLADDPTLREDEVHRLFRLEGAGPALHHHDYRAAEEGEDHLWSACIARLLPRQTVLDLVLSALRRDWAPQDVTWYVGLHRRLRPTPTESAPHQSSYRALLSATASVVVGLAQDVLGEILAAKLLDLGAFLDIADAPMHRPEKVVAQKQIALLRKVAVAVPDRMPWCAKAVVPALTHPHAAIREAGAKALLALKADSDPEVAAGVRDCLPSLGGRAADLLAPTFAQPAPGRSFADVPTPRRTPLAVQPSELPLLEPDRVESVLVHLLEEADDPILVEQVLDYVTRHADRPPTSAALLEQAESRLEWHLLYRGTNVRVDLAQVVVSWMSGRPPLRPVQLDAMPYFDGRVVGSRPDDSVRETLSLGTIVSARLREVALVAARGRPRTLLAAPTRADGTISAADLRTRLDAVAANDGMLPKDLETAVLRAGPAVMKDVLAATPRPEGRLTRAAADLECAFDWQRCTGPLGGTSNGLAAFPGIYRYDRRPPVVVWRLASAPVGWPDRIIRSLFDLDDPLARAGYRWDDSDPFWSARRHDQMVACWPLLAPHHTDIVLAQAHPLLCRSVWEVRADAIPLMQNLATLSTPPGEPSWSALSLALSGKNPTLRTAAVDAFVGLVSTNLMDGTAPGRISGDHAADQMIFVQRLLDTLREVAEVDAACTWRVLDTLEGLLPGLVGHRDFGRALLLTDELAQRCGRSVALPPDANASRAAAKTMRRLAGRTDLATATRSEAASLIAGSSR